MAGVDKCLRLDDQHWTGLTRFGAPAWIEIREPDLAALSHPDRALSRRTLHSPACFPCGPRAAPDPPPRGVREPRPRGSCARWHDEYILRAGFRARAHIDCWSLAV